MRPFINVSSVFLNRMLKVYSLHLASSPTIASITQQLKTLNNHCLNICVCCVVVLLFGFCAVLYTSYVITVVKYSIFGQIIYLYLQCKIDKGI